jgi:phospholipid/cholesterol/gamma-HCH transport system permease protein
MFPVLYAVACFVGIAGGLIAGELGDLIPAREFIEGGRLYFKPYDVTFGVIKSLVFGFTITAISCTKGYYTDGGAEGVGRSTTQAAVQSCVFVLLGDYILAALLL